MRRILSARQAGTKPAANRVYVGCPSKWPPTGHFLPGPSRHRTREKALAAGAVTR
jgi:hypothetical protein